MAYQFENIKLEKGMYHEGGRSFTQVLEKLDPSEKYKGTALEGIRRTAQTLQKGEIVICKGCDAAAREFSMYCWDLKSGQDKVVKEHDHAMDEIRYFVMSLEKSEPLAAVAVERGRF